MMDHCVLKHEGMRSFCVGDIDDDGDSNNNVHNNNNNNNNKRNLK
jgi:hypothetical protein